MKRYHYTGIFLKIEEGAVLAFDSHKMNPRTPITQKRILVDVTGFDLYTGYFP